MPQPPRPTSPNFRSRPAVSSWNEMAPQALREAKDPIDGTHGCAQKMVFLVSTEEAVKPCARPKDAYFRTAATRFQAGVRLTLILFIYQGACPVERCHSGCGLPERLLERL
eukprot:gene21744-biopygen23654